MSTRFWWGIPWAARWLCVQPPQQVPQLHQHSMLVRHRQLVPHLRGGPTRETLARMDNPFRLEDDAGVLVEGTIRELDQHWHLARFEFDGGSLWLRRDNGMKIGDRVRIQLLSRDISLALEENPDQSIQNLIPATIDRIEPDVTPGVSIVRLLAGPTPVMSRLTTRAVDQLALEPGREVWMQIKSVALAD